MSASVDPQYLLEGAVFALEQSGVLLRDAALLYRSGSHASGVALAAFAREELGRWKILLSLRGNVFNGETLTIDDIKARCEDHVTKQRAGMLSLTMRADQDTRAGQLIMSRIMSSPGSEEWAKTDAAIAQIDRSKKKRVPHDRHEQRESALYVDPISPDRWNRPSAAISREFARQFIEDARNDYAIQCLNRYNDFAVLRDVDAELCKALEGWSDRPTLPLPEGPLPF
jgi:AbiV family abortive infection protein